VLGFVARRLEAESVVLLMGGRSFDDRAELSGLPLLVLGALSDADAGQLLASALPGRFDEGVQDRIVAEAQGNPLALIELPRTSAAAELAGGFGVPDAAVSGRVGVVPVARVRAPVARVSAVAVAVHRGDEHIELLAVEAALPSRGSIAADVTGVGPAADRRQRDAEVAGCL